MLEYENVLDKNNDIKSVKVYLGDEEHESDNTPREESIISLNHSQQYCKYGSRMADIGITIRMLEKNIREAQDITNIEKSDLLDIFSNILICHGKTMRID